MPGDVRDLKSVAGIRQGSLVDRVVLEHHQRVEQLAQAGQALDLRQAKMLMRHQPRLTILKRGQQRRQRPVRR